MMDQIPDAPWIREAERKGIPPYDDLPDPVCPVCGKECVTIYLDDGCLNVIGCDNCIRKMDACEWQEEEMANRGPEE